MKLSLFITLSLLGHGIVIIPWSGTSEFSVSSEPSSFHVSLLQPPVINPAVLNPGKKLIEKKSPVSAEEKQVEEKEIRKTKQPENIARVTYKTNTEDRAYIISQIRHKMAHHFKYPLLARRNGWQGKVILALLLEPDGSIENVHVKSGSGYNILDQSALSALMKVKHIQHVENLLNIHQQEIIIPVIYHLEEG